MAEVRELDVPPVERLRGYLDRMHLWYLQHLERASVYLNQQHHLTGKNRVEMDEHAREFEHFLRELLAEARGAGSLRQDLDLRLASFFLLGAMNGLPRWYQPKGDYSADPVAAQFTEMSLRALHADPAPPAPAARKRRSTA